MTARKVFTTVSMAAVMAAGLGLSACGKQGNLDRPAPLWGSAEKAKYAAQQRAASAGANKESQPGSVRENTDPATSTATTRQQTAPGANPDPFGGPSGPGFPNSGPH